MSQLPEKTQAWLPEPLPDEVRSLHRATWHASTMLRASR